MRRPGLAPLTALILLFAGLLAFGQNQSAPDASPTPPADSPQPDLTPDANGKLSERQMQDLRQVVMEHYRANYAKRRDYTYTVRKVENKLDGKGEIKSSESKTYEVMELYGEPVERLIAKDDKPLSGKDAAKEEEEIEKLTNQRKNESAEDRAQRRAEEEKQREKNREFVREVADAYDFRLVGSEMLNGRDTWVIAGEPRAGFQAHLKDAQILPKYHGRLWIDKSELQLVKLDVEAIDTVSFDWILARIHKGTRLVIEQTRVNEEVWLPQHLRFRLDARVALFKSYNEEYEDTFRDYKKFRATTKIVSVGDVKP
ncbi:MAG: hypothetical protein WB683_07465 [Candidatus Sulfotelmatobacter sp.]